MCLIHKSNFISFLVSFEINKLCKLTLKNTLIKLKTNLIVITAFDAIEHFISYYRIGLRFGTLLDVLKRKKSPLNQPFLTNGSSLFHQKNFLKIKNSISPVKYTRYGKNVKKENCFCQKYLQLWC